MRKGILIFVAFVVLVSFSACSQSIQPDKTSELSTNSGQTVFSPSPMPDDETVYDSDISDIDDTVFSPSPMPDDETVYDSDMSDIDDTVTAQSLTIEAAAELYCRFLEGEIPSADGVWLPMYYGLDHLKNLAMVRNLTGNEIPELYFEGPWVMGAIWGIEYGQIVCLEHLGTYHKILSNGGIFYYRSDGLPHHDDYQYRGFSAESREYPDVYFSIYPAYTIEGHTEKEKCFLDGEEVSREEWQAVADVYFALRDEEPDDTQLPTTFSQWLELLGLSFEPLPLSEAKASFIYWRFLADKEIGYDLEGNHIWCDRWYQNYNLKGLTQFLVWDFTGDGIPEVYLPIFSKDVWTIRDNHVALLGKLDDMESSPEYSVPFIEWLDEHRNL